MKLYQQNTVGVGVYDGTDAYVDTLEHFEADMGGPAPALPASITHRVYQPDIRHALNINDSTVDGGPMPWPEGDAIIAAIATLITNKAAREEAAAQSRLLNEGA